MSAGMKAKQERQTPVILVALGDAYERNYASVLLQRFGYHVYTVNTAEEAAQFMGAAVPGLVIAEARLANPGGADLLAAMKQDPGTAAVPVLLASPAIDPKAEKRYRDAGYAGVLPMPLSAEALYRAVQDTLEAHPRRSIRVAVDVMADLRGNPANLARHAVVLSEDGMFVLTTAPRPVGTRLPVSFVIKDWTIHAEAVVLYSHGFDDYPFKQMGMGMSFVRLSPEDKVLIRSFVQEQIERGITNMR